MSAKAFIPPGYGAALVEPAGDFAGRQVSLLPRRERLRVQEPPAHLVRRAAVAAVIAGAVTLAFGGRPAGAGSSSHAHVHRTVERRIAGLGPVITSAHGGAIDGWGIDENGRDGVLSEVFSRGRFSLITTVETFDQSTGAITKVVAKQQSVSGNKKFVVASMLAGDLGLIDDRRYQRDGRRDTFYVLSGVEGGVFIGRWTPPVAHNFSIASVADQQTNPVVAILADVEHLGAPNEPEVLTSNVSADTIAAVLKFPRDQALSGPQLIAQDTALNVAVVAAQDTRDHLADFVVFDLSTGGVSTFPAVDGAGAVQGIAIDSSTGIMCTTTGNDFSVQFTNLTSHEGLSEPLPSATDASQSGAAVAVDAANHLFLVSQPNSSVSPSGGSTIYVYDEKGDLQRSIDGFSFSNTGSTGPAHVRVNVTHRLGFVNGPKADQIQTFLY
jgi:hypothetical protein